MKQPAASSAAAALFALAATSSELARPAHSFSLKMSTQAASASASSSPSPKRKAVSSVEENGSRHPLDSLGRNFDHSWIGRLDPEHPENRRKASLYARGLDHEDKLNQCSRPVFNGHYVEVAPTPLRNPRLVVHSADMAKRLGLTEEDVKTEEFVKYFSGDVEGAFASHQDSDHIDTRTWATPYALSIMGTRYTNNCPFGTGDGYGDGRAISVGEVSVPAEAMDGPSSPRYELQLKGAGRTPFCRGADGRAVLRSSVREFLASEAMHHLGVKTTRALSLIVSDGPDGDTSHRPWYSKDNVRTLPSMDDPRLAQYTEAQRKQILRQLAVQARDDPDVMITEPNAITCRVAPSFVRVGHIDLFARRATRKLVELSDDEGDDGDGNGDGDSGGDKDARRATEELNIDGDDGDGDGDGDGDSGGDSDGASASASAGAGAAPKYDTSSAEWAELEKMIWHAAFREFPSTAYDPYHEKDDLVGAARALLDDSAEAISSMVAGWLRVGFAQGNFNADNCLVGGRTMDYGPFGFVDEYDPLFAKWTGSGEHFGFLNQPQAAFANYAVLVESVMPVIYDRLGEEEGDRAQAEIMGRAQRTFQSKFDAVFRTKLGFAAEDESADAIWRAAEPLLRECRADWTLFWRRLTEVAAEFASTSEAYGDMLELLCGNDEVREGSSPFHETLDAERRSKLLRWIQTWREGLAKSSASDDAAGRMRAANPKYILREWMLVDAYTRASEGDEYMIAELLELVQKPYDEGTEEQIEKYYRRAPDEALKAGGTAYMS